MEEIASIYCIGRNYANHAKELGNEVPTEPLLFGKPKSAAVLADGRTLLYPSDKGAIHYEAEIVLKIDKDMEDGDTLDDVVTEMAIGVDLTLRDLQSKLKQKGHPWLRAKGFRNSAILTPFFPFPGEQESKSIDFSLEQNGEVVQLGNTENMLFSFSEIVQECHLAFGLKKGDLLFTGTPEGVGAIADNDQFNLAFQGETKGTFFVRMESKE
ncbi:fumarylacetoacetate hydrolase family protein [Shouchella clausii]|uniref:fumarylacetoacetate hydrolase family protein n=2 Tax=Bacillaceae TaxID=186817 RepID=UPI000BA60653|nr:fumarylacetoacetate hydrolase family protein [Shouchella clausii]PAD92142.1 fumarylacetoacetate hydrolase [Shouchella clausii]